MNNNELIKVGYCIAYDWELLRYSIPAIYKEAHLICLSIDKNRQSWAGEPFTWDEQGFRKMVAELDTENKIRVYEDVFYDASLQPMQNEVAQRNKIARFMGEGGWHLQLDADEYFIDFKGFVAFLQAFKTNRKVNICCPMITLYKEVKGGFLWVSPDAFSQVEFFAIATKYPLYEYGRRNGYFDIHTNFPILHQSWARSEEQIWEKLNNWGHKNDIDIHKCFSLWKEANAHNYHTYTNFHHLHPRTWPALQLYTINNIADLLQTKRADFPLPLNSFRLMSANSIWISRAKKVWKMMFK